MFLFYKEFVYKLINLLFLVLSFIFYLKEGFVFFNKLKDTGVVFIEFF